MIFDENKFGYDPDNYDDEPSDYVNSDNAYNADDISSDSAEEFNSEEDDEVAGTDNNDLEDDFEEDEDPEVDYDEDDSDVTEDDPINDDVTDYPSTEPAAFHSEVKKPVYIKDMPYIDHATPGVTSN